MDGYDELERKDQTAVRLRKRRSGGTWVLMLLLCVAALIWFAPSIVAKTSLRNQLISWAAPDFPGRVSIGSASAGWMRPIELRDIAVWDVDGQPLARVPLVTSTKQLFSMVSDYQQLGTFQLHQPEVQLVVTEDSSNLEQLLHPLLSQTTDSAHPAGTSVGVGVTVTEGRLLVTDAVSGQTCTVENLELQLQLPKSQPAPITVHLTADAQQNAQRGNISADFHWQQPKEISPSDLGDGQLQIVSQGFPLAALQPVWRRAQANLDVQGQLDSEMDCRWKRTEQGPAILAKGHLSLHQPQLRAPQLIGNDQLRLQRIAADLDIEAADNLVTLKAIQLTSDLANLQVAGNAVLSELMSDQTVAEKLLDWRSSHQYQVRGQIDLATAANQLPETLRLKGGTRISQGNLELEINSRIDLGQRVVQGSLQTDQIEAIAGGRTVTWDQPIHLAIDGVSGAEGLQVRRLDCQSDFLQFQAAGTLEDGQLQAHGDLNRLVSQLGQFCELGDLQLAGRMTAEGSWQRLSDNQCEGQLNASIQEFAMASSQVPPLREQQLTFQTTARGVVDPQQGIQKLATCLLKIVSGEDELVATLQQPVQSPTANSTWPLACELKGHTESWLARLRPWGVTIPGWEVRAGVTATADGTFHPSQVALKACHVDLTGLSASSDGWLIREPQVQLQGTLAWKSPGNEISAPTLTITSSTLSMRAERVHVVSSGENTLASGALAFRGDLARLASWQYAETPPTSRPRGQFQGQVQLATQQGTISYRGSADVTDFVYEQLTTPPPGTAASSAWSATWHEPSIRIVSAGAYLPSADKFSFEQFEVAGSGLSLAASGDLTAATSQPMAEIRGELSYDLAVVTSKFSQLLGPDVRLTGQRRQPFTISGPLTATSVAMTDAQDIPATQLASASVAAPIIPRELAAQTTLAWDALEAYGIQLGPQEIQTRLQQGTVFFSPLQTTLAQGRLTIAPRLELNATPMSLVVDAGKVAENIQITPEMCQSWFKYITPVLAGAASAEGQLSMSIQGAHVPLDQPTAATVTGSVTIHGARVQPGPMAQQLLGTVREVAAILDRAAPSLNFLEQGENWLELQPQNIDFQMSGGRVYHRNLELTSGKITLRTQGWVGMDQSMGLLAEIPILDEWVAGEQLLAGLQGQTLKIPIQGSFSQPQLDRRAIAGLSQQLIGNTAQRLIQGELQKGLEKLLGN